MYILYTYASTNFQKGYMQYSENIFCDRCAIARMKIIPDIIHRGFISLYLWRFAKLLAV